KEPAGGGSQPVGLVAPQGAVGGTHQTVGGQQEHVAYPGDLTKFVHEPGQVGQHQVSSRFSAGGAGRVCACHWVMRWLVAARSRGGSILRGEAASGEMVAPRRRRGSCAGRSPPGCSTAPSSAVAGA